MSHSHRIVRNVRTGEVILSSAQWCASFWCHLKGLQFRRNLPQDEGLLFVTPTASIVATTIHMLNMFMDIGVIWLDSEGVVVHTVHAKAWRLAYAPSKPAQYYIEANTSILSKVNVGDKLRWDELAS